MNNVFEHDGFQGEDEQQYTGLRLVVSGQATAERYEPGPNEVCISVDSTGHGIIPPKLQDGWADVLRLKFDDVVQDGTLRTITRRQAEAVVQFFAKHQDKKMCLIHCFAGVSRSRSLAGALAICFELPYRYTMLNWTVRQAIFNAYQELYNISDEDMIRKVRANGEIP